MKSSTAQAIDEHTELGETTCLWCTAIGSFVAVFFLFTAVLTA